MTQISKILLVLVLVALVGCKTKSPQYVPVQTKTTVTERLVPVTLPADSTWLKLWLECDSNSNVIIKSMNQAGTLQQDVKLADNVLDVSTIKPKSVLHVAAKDSILEREVPVRVEVPVKVNVLKWHQKLLIWWGVLTLGLALGRILLMIKKIKI